MLEPSDLTPSQKADLELLQSKLTKWYCLALDNPDYIEPDKHDYGDAVSSLWFDLTEVEYTTRWNDGDKLPHPERVARINVTYTVESKL